MFYPRNPADCIDSLACFKRCNLAAYQDITAAEVCPLIVLLQHDEGRVLCYLCRQP